MKVSEMKAELEDLGVEVPNGSLKADLEALLEASTPVEESTEEVFEEITEEALEEAFEEVLEEVLEEVVEETFDEKPVLRAEDIVFYNDKNPVRIVSKQTVVIHGRSWTELKLEDGTTVLT